MKNKLTNFEEEFKTVKYTKPISNCKRFKFYFKMIDMYAIPINMRYKNQKMFFTNFGALISLSIYIVVLTMLLRDINIVWIKDVDEITTQVANQLAKNDNEDA